MSCYLNDRKKRRNKNKKIKKKRVQREKVGRRWKEKEKEKERTSSFVVCCALVHKKEKRARCCCTNSRGLKFKLEEDKIHPSCKVERELRSSWKKKTFLYVWDFDLGFFREKRESRRWRGENSVVPSHPLLNHNGFGNDMIREWSTGNSKKFQIPSRIRTPFFFPELEWTCWALTTTNYHLTTTIGKITFFCLLQSRTPAITTKRNFTSPAVNLAPIGTWNNVSFNKQILLISTDTSKSFTFHFFQKSVSPLALGRCKSSSSFNNISPPLCQQQKKETIIDGVIIAHSLGKDYLWTTSKKWRWPSKLYNNRLNLIITARQINDSFECLVDTHLKAIRTSFIMLTTPNIRMFPAVPNTLELL